MFRKKILIGTAILLVICSVGLILFLALQKPKAPQIKISETKVGELASSFPDFPVYDGAKVVNSFKGSENGKEVYGAVWQINGKSLDDVVDWYEDSEKGLPANWIFLEPLQKDSETDPKSEWMKVNKDDWDVLVTIQQDSSDKPVVVNIQATKTK